MQPQVGFANGIGNFVIFTQILQCIHNHFGKKINLFLDGEAAIVQNDTIRMMAERLPFIDKVFIYPEGYEKSSFKFMSELNNPCPLYTEFVGSDVNFNTFKGWALGYVSETNFYLSELDKKIGYRGKLFPPRVPYLKKSLLEPMGISQYVCVANGYSEGLERKAYRRWGEVVYLLSRFYPDMPIVILGWKGDSEWAFSLEAVSPFVINMIGRTNILEVATIIKKSRLLLSVDTGLYHIADALHVPNIALFGSTLISKNGPLNGSTRIIATPRACAPCQATPFWNLCDQSGECLDLIEPLQVFSLARTILQTS